MSFWIWAVGLCVVALAYGLLYALCRASGEADDATERWAARWIEAWEANHEGGDW